MKKITTFLAALLFVVTTKAQVPPFPSNESVVARVKQSYLFKPNSILTTDYGVKDFTKLTVSAIAYVGDKNDQAIPSNKMYTTKTSDRAAELFWKSKPLPEDECYTVVTITTPKDANSIYYDINVTVSYTRLKNDALTNVWEPNIIKVTAPFIRGLIITDAVKEAVFVEALKEFNAGNQDIEEKFTLKNGQELSEITGLKNIFKINSLTPSKTKSDYSISANEMVWTFDCDALCYDDFTQVEDGMTMKDSDIPTLIKKPILNVSVAAKLVNGKWIPTQVTALKNGATDVSKFDGNYNAVFKNIGIVGVFKKSTPAKLPQ